MTHGILTLWEKIRAGKKPQIGSIRPMDEMTWEAFAGAIAFNDQSPPLIFELPYPDCYLLGTASGDAIQFYVHVSDDLVTSGGDEETENTCWDVRFIIPGMTKSAIILIFTAMFGAIQKVRNRAAIIEQFKQWGLEQL